MDALFDAVSPLTDASTWLPLLIACTWKGTLILGIAWLIARLFLRQASAAARHWAWSLAFASVLMLPVLAIIVPTWTVTVWNDPLPAGIQHLAEQWMPGGVPGDEAPAPPSLAAMPVPEAPAAPATPTLAEAPAPAETPPAVAPQDGFAVPLDWARWASLLWLLGASATFGYFLIGSLRAWWWSRRAAPVREEDWQALKQDIAWQLYLTRPVRLAWSTRAVTPMTHGVFRPQVLLPYSAEAWSPERRRVVLLHELAHVQRWDCLTQALAQVACAFNWFNPLIWWSACQLRIERERACDDRVLTSGTKASTYAEHLLEIARSFRMSPGMPLGAVSMARRSQLEGRLLAILEPGLRRHARRAVTILTGLIFAGALIPLAAMQPWLAIPSEMDAPPPLTASTPPPLPAHERPAAHETPAAATPPTEAVPSALSSVAPVPDAPAKRDVIRRTFSVQPGGTLTVDTDLGSIEVRSGQDNEVQVEVTREADDEEDIQALEVSFEQQGDDIVVRGEHEGRRNWSWNNNLEVHFVITVPRRYNVDLETAGGSIAVDDLEGEVRTQTSGGSLSFGQITGDVWGETSGGSISLQGSRGDAQLHTSGGSISLGDIEGDVEAKTSGGSISLGAVRGTVYAKTSGGSINVDEVQGDIEAATSGGSVTARITRQPQGDCRLETSGGSVTVYLADGIGMDVDAQTSHGRVTTDFSVPSEAWNEEHSSLEAEINGGGPTLFLRTSAGRIRINRVTASGEYRNGPNAPSDPEHWQAHVERSVEAAVEKQTIEQQTYTAHEALRETVSGMLQQLEAVGDNSWLKHTVAAAAAGLLEEVAYDEPEIEVQIDGRTDVVCLLDVLADLPDDAGTAALTRIARTHSDRSVREQANELLEGKRCPEEQQRREAAQSQVTVEFRS